MNRLFPLAVALLLSSCCIVEEEPPVHHDAEYYHYEPLSEGEETRLRQALSKYASIKLEREWFRAVEREDDEGMRKRSCTLLRNETLDKRLFPLRAVRRWYGERWNEGCVVMPNWAIISCITFLDAEGCELYSLNSTSSVYRRGEDGQALDIIDSFDRFFPAKEQEKSAP